MEMIHLKFQRCRGMISPRYELCSSSSLQCDVASFTVEDEISSEIRYLGRDEFIVEMISYMQERFIQVEKIEEL